MLFDLSFKTKWSELKQRKLEASHENTIRENLKRVQHTYKVGDKVLLDRGVL